VEAGYAATIVSLMALLPFPVASLADPIPASEREPAGVMET
jgi:hypothetical protein